MAKPLAGSLEVDHMLTAFDIHTLITVSIVGNVISLILLIVDIKYDKSSKDEWFFIFGRVCQTLGLVLIAQRGAISNFLSLTVGNSLIIAGQALESMAWVSLKAETAKIRRLSFGASLGVALVFLCHILPQFNLKVRITLLMLLQSVFMIMPGFYLIFYRKRSSPAQTVIGTLYVLGFLASLWRYFYMMSMSNYLLFAPDLPNSAFYVIVIFLLFGGSQGYILVKKEYLNHALEDSIRDLHREKETVAYYETELRKHQVERAEFKALQAQIKPHFLQNTLGAIGHFCRVDPGKAQQLLRDLSTYLRGTFELTADYVQLEDELKIVRAYLAIETVRFGSRLNISYETEGNLSACMIPPFTLQPLVENAVRHGIAPRRQGGTIRICIREADECVVFQVEDDGVGISGDIMDLLCNERITTRQDGQGLGLFNVDQRLKSMFGSGLRIERLLGHGTRVSFFIPRKLSNRFKEVNG